MVDSPIQLFRAACGATGPLRLHIEGPGPEVRLWSTEPPLALLGRDAYCDLPLNYEPIQKRHTYLQIIEGRVFCITLPTPPGVPAASGADPATWLERGQAIRVGPVWVRLLDGDQVPADAPTSGWSPLAAQPPEQSSLPGVTLEILEGAPQVLTWRMDRVLALIGRSSSCKVRLVDSSVSLVHGSLVRTSAGVWIVDLLGRGGLMVNGSRVHWACLQDGDRLQVGKFVIRFRCEPPTYLPALSGSRAMAAPARRPVAVAPSNESGLPIPAPGSEAALVPASLRPAGPDANQAYLMPLVSQFAQMQQDMFDQFQQGLQMVVQMFSSLHREQMVHIRGELDRLHELTTELNSLKAELAKNPPQTPPAPAGQQPAMPPSAVTGGSVPAHERSRPDKINPAGPSPLPSSLPPLSPAKAPPTAAASGAPSPPDLAPLPGESDEDIHLWLSRRIASVQQERQNRWQKIVGFLTAGRTGANVP